MTYFVGTECNSAQSNRWPNLFAYQRDRVSGKVDLIKYDFKTGEKSCPLLEEGILLKVEPKLSLEIGVFSYSHEFPKLEYILKF